jgi:hypothetical protein
MRKYAWYAITNLGNISILLPLALLIALLLWLPASTRRLCVVWFVIVVVVETIVAATKVLYMGWGLGITSLDFTGLSGHAALSLLVWPVAFSLLVRHKDALRAFGVTFGFLLASVIAVSRLEIHAHSVAEVVFGGILGAAASSLFLVRYRRLFHVVALPRWLAMTLILPFAIGYGHAMPTESTLEGVARILSGHSYVYTRADLHSSTFHSPALCVSLPKPHSPYRSDEADGRDMSMPRRPKRGSAFQELSTWLFPGCDLREILRRRGANALARFISEPLLVRHFGRPAAQEKRERQPER